MSDRHAEKHGASGSKASPALGFRLHLILGLGRVGSLKLALLPCFNRKQRLAIFPGEEWKPVLGLAAVARIRLHLNAPQSFPSVHVAKEWFPSPPIRGYAGAKRVARRCLFAPFAEWLMARPSLLRVERDWSVAGWSAAGEVACHWPASYSPHDERKTLLMAAAARVAVGRLEPAKARPASATRSSGEDFSSLRAGDYSRMMPRCSETATASVRSCTPSF